MGSSFPQLSSSGWRTWAAIFLLFGILLVSQRTGLAARQHETCVAINETKAALVSYIDQQIDRSAKSLPTVDYYKRHPVELGRALANLAQQRQQTHEAFAQSDC